jgi:hypothetical protein
MNNNYFNIIIVYRLSLAAMHYNENNERPQALSKDGRRQFSMLFPKYKKGDHIVREIKENSTYG